MSCASTHLSVLPVGIVVERSFVKASLLIALVFLRSQKMYSIPKIKEKIYTSHLFDKGNVIYKKDYAKKAHYR